MTIDKSKSIFKVFFILSCLLILLAGCSEETANTVTITMDVQPTSMHREVVVDSNPELQKINVTIPSAQPILFSATVQEPWIRLSIFGGGEVVDRPAPDSFVISITSRTLNSGFYIDTVWVTASDAINSPYGIEVTLLVGDSLEFTPREIEFTASTFSGTPESQTLSVTSTAGEGVDFSLTKKSAWLTISEPTGTVPKDIEIGVNQAGLTPGYYYDTISLDAPLAVNSPDSIPCLLGVFSWDKIDHPRINKTSLEAAFFIDDMNGWIVGNINTVPRTGYVIATDDGGDNWVVQTEDIVGILGDVVFLDQNTGFVCGEYGLVRKTTNGGDDWLTKNIPDSTDPDLVSISFIDFNNGWICGDNGSILYTSDVGETWVSQTSNVAYNLNAIHFTSADSGWVVGNAQTILFTSDGGNNWIPQTSPISTDYRDVYFINNAEGWAVGLNGAITHTSNSGNTWNQLSGSLNTEYRSISFCPCGEGWIVGNDGTVLYSTNGISWVEQISGTDEILQGAFMISNSKGWVVGQNGVILYTEVGGH